MVDDLVKHQEVAYLPSLFGGGGESGVWAGGRFEVFFSIIQHLNCCGFIVA